MRHYVQPALLGATALALEAYTNISPAGAAFLALFLLWGLLATRPSAPAAANAAAAAAATHFPSPRRPRRNVAAAAVAALILWSCAAAAACVTLLLQLLLPLLASAGAVGPAAGPDSVLWRLLGLRNLGQCGVWELLLVLGPPLLATCAALAEVQEAYAACCDGGTNAADGGSGNGSSSGEGGGSGSGSGDRTTCSVGTHNGRTRGQSQAGGSNGGIVSGSGGGGAGDGGGSGGEHGTSAASAIAGMLVALAALLWPAVFNLPWLLLASLAVAAWALRRRLPSAALAPLLRLFQCYCGLCLAVLYVWQLQPPDEWPPYVSRGARALGVYRINPSAVPLYDSVPQLLHLAALTALYGALGFAAAAAAEKQLYRRRGQQPPQRQGVTHGSSSRPHMEPSAIEAPAGELISDAAASTAAGAAMMATGFAADDVLISRMRPPRPPPPQPALQQRTHHKPQHLHRQEHLHGHPQQSHPHRRSAASGGGGGGGAVTATAAAARVADRCAAAAVSLCRHPAVAAVALACLSMVEVSVVGGGLLALGMWTLLAPSRYGRRMLRRCSPALTLLLLLWNTAVYVITCLSTSYPSLLPPVLHSLGLFMYESPPPVVLPLAGQVLAILTMAGLARSTRSGSSSSSTGQDFDDSGTVASRAMAAAPPPAAGREGLGAGGGGGGGSTLGPLGLTCVLALYHLLHVLVPVSWILLGSYRLDVLHGAYLLWVLLYCGGTALRLSPDPRVGRVLPDIAEYEKYDTRAYSSADSTDGGSAVGAEGTPAAAAASPPPLPAAPPAHRRLRLYASLHLLALYGAMCGQLPGLGLLQREQWRAVLQQVGLWDPARTRDCLPLLGALVLATVHAVAGKFLTAAAVQSPPPSPATHGSLQASAAVAAPVRVMGWLTALGSWLGSVASSVGYLLVAALLYGLVLYDMRMCVAGLGYLALGLPLLLAPPLRGQYLARLRLSHHASSRRRLRQPHLYLSSVPSRDCIPATARWLGPAALALYAALDLSVSYAAAMLEVYDRDLPDGGGGGNGGDEPSAAAEWLWWGRRVLVLLYGGPPEAPGSRLVAALARPASLLLVLQLYRWAFAAASVSQWLQQYSGWQARRDTVAPSPPTTSAAAAPPLLQPLLPPPAEATALPWTPAAAAESAPAVVRQRRLLHQESTAWLFKRWVILNIDLIAMVLLFATLMASPGALSVGLLAAAVAAIVAAAWSAAAAAAASGGGRRRRMSDGGSRGAAEETILEEEDWSGEEEEVEGEVVAGREPGRGRSREGGGGGGAGLGRLYGTPAAAAAAGPDGGGGARVGDTAAAAGFFASAQIVLAAWLLVSYSLQLGMLAEWIRSASKPYDKGAHGGGDGGYAPWSPVVVLDWLGLPPCELKHGVPSPPPPRHLPYSSSVYDVTMTAGAVADAGITAGGAAAAALRRILLWAASAAAAALGVGADGRGGGGGSSGSGGGGGDVAECTAVPGLRRQLLLQLLTLLALALRSKARRWRSMLPPEVQAAAAPGQPCCLFWPPPHCRPDSAVLPWLGPHAPLQRAVRRALAPVVSLANQILFRLGRGAYDVLKAMDVPADELVPASSGDDGDGDTGVAESRGPVAGADVVRHLQRPPATAAPPPHPSTSRRDGAAAAGDGGGGSAGMPPPPPPSGGHLSYAVGDDVSGGDGGGDLTAAWLLFVRLVLRGCMEAWEGGWAAAGGEVALLALLVAAFTAANVATLLLLAAVGAGMAARPSLQAVLRRYVVLPILGVVLLYEYGAWVGLPRLLLLPAFGQPPSTGRTHGSHLPKSAAEWAHLPPALAAWLGLQDVGSLLLWTLFGALAACLMQVNCELSQQQEQQQQQQQRNLAHQASVEAEAEAGVASRRAERRSRSGSGSFWRRRHRWFWSSSAAAAAAEAEAEAGAADDNDLEAPLLPQQQQLPPPQPPTAAPPSASHQGRELLGKDAAGGGTSDGAAGGGGGGGAHGGRTFLFSPMTTWAQPYWGVLDWARYYMVLHSADLLLVALVALVAVQRDLLRAGYLAHCLLLFRRRNELARPYGSVAAGGGSGGGLALFGRLVVFNFLVLVLEGAFQAPWELLLGRAWAQPCAFAAVGPDDSGSAAAAPACTFPRLMGLCQLHPGRSEDGGSDEDILSVSYHQYTPYDAWRRMLGGGGGAAAGGGFWAPWIALLNSPVVADLLVWLLLRLYLRVLRSPLLAEVTRVAAAAAQRHVAALRRAARDGKEAAARAALAASHARAVRERRIAKLKALLLSPGDAAASDGPARGGAAGNGAAAAAAYARALSANGGGGGAGGVSGLLFAPGGGPMVAGLAELLDADVDLADVAAAAAASGEAPPTAASRRQPYDAAYGPEGGGGVSDGGSRVRWDVAAGGSGDGGGGGFAAARAMSSRRTRSHTDLDELGSNGSDARGPPLGRSPSGGGGGGHLATRPSHLPSTAAAGVHRRHASAETLGSYTATDSASGGGGRRDSAATHTTPVGGGDGDHDPTAAAAAAETEIQPFASSIARQAAAAAAAAGTTAPRRRRRLSWPPFMVRLYGKFVAPLLAAASRRRREDDSYVCYGAFLALFLVDMTALSAVLPLSMFMYALLVQRKPRQYWQGVLLYVETVLILQYSYLVLGKCLCATGGSSGGGGTASGGGSSCIWVFGRRDFLFRIKVLGLHSDPLRALPLFLCYLATLMHSYGLDIVYAAVAASATTPLQAAPSSADVTTRATATASGGGGSSTGGGGPEHTPSEPELQQRPPWLSFMRLRQWLGRCLTAFWAVMLHLRDVYRHVTADHEIPPHWVKLQLQLPPSPHLPPPQQPQQRGMGTEQPSGAPPPQRPPSPSSPPPSGPDSRQLEGESVLDVVAGGGSETAPAAAPAALPPSPPLLGEVADEAEGAAAAAAAAAAAGGVSPPVSLAVLRGARLVAVLQQMLLDVYEHGQAVRQARAEEERWRRQRAALLQDEDEDDEPTARGNAGGDGGGGGDVSAADVALRLSNFLLPRLRLQHEAIASGGSGMHVMLEVVVPQPPPAAAAAIAGSGGGGGGGGGLPLLASPTPARDVAAALRVAFEALARERQAALSVPPFRRTAGGSATAAVPSARYFPPPPPASAAASASASAADDGVAVPAYQEAGGSSAAHPTTARGGDDEDESAAALTATAAALPARLLRSDSTASRRDDGSGGGGSDGDGGLRHRRRSVAVQAPPPPPHHRRHGSGGAGSEASAATLPPPSPPPPPPPPELHVSEPPSGLLPLQSAECYSQPPRDFYAATAFLDLVSFMYAMVFYQLVVSSARSLADITDTDRRLPLDYLAALMLLFALMVSERAVYMLGLPAAKMALHVASQAIVLGWCLRAYWQSLAAEGFGAAAAGSPGGGSGGDGSNGGSGGSLAEAAAAGVRQHLRVFLLLRCLGMCLGALQLRDGYPPLSAPGPSGGGRHSSFFYRRADLSHNLAFNVFYSLPFLYEIRSLLDWTCISTALDWYAWLKLEDIRSSLFVASCRNQSRRSRRIGERVPRYVKFLQGVLALVGLLLVLWLPPLFFSSGAPTYQVPALQDVHLNISIAQLAAGPAAASVQRFPIFASGDRRLVFQWTAPSPQQQQPAPPTHGSPPLPPPLTSPPLRPRPRPPRRDVLRVDQGQQQQQPLLWKEDEEQQRQQQRRLHAPVDSKLEGEGAGGRSRGGAPPPSLSPPPQSPPPAPSKGGGGSSSGGGGGGLPRALAGYRPDQTMGACLAAESDRTWRISPPARTALRRLLLPPSAGGGGGGPPSSSAAAAAGYLGGLHDDNPPVVLEVRWSLLRSAPLGSQRGGPGCAATAAVPLSAPSRRGLADLLTGSTNRTLLTSLNQTHPESHGSPALFPLFLRLKGDACSVRLGLSGDAAATPSVTSVAAAPVRTAPQWAAGGSSSSASPRRSLLSAFWPWNAGGGGAVAAPSAAAASSSDVADRWGAAMVGCYASLQRDGGGGGGGGGAEWWTFECGALLPPSGSSGGGGGGGDDGDGGGADGGDGDMLWTSSGVLENGGSAGGGRGTTAVEAAAAMADDGEGGGDLLDACGSAPGGSPGLSGPPLVAVLEPVQSGLLGATLSRFGITGLYVTFVFAIGRFLRLSVSSLRLRIPTEDLPSTRRLVALCQDIYVARAEGELVLEEQLFQALINVYRSPELLFELSRKNKQA